MKADTTDRRGAIKALGLRWSEIMLDLEAGVTPMDHRQSEDTLVTAMSYWANGLLTWANVRDLAVGLNHALLTEQRYATEGSWEHEHDDALGARTDTERRAFLATESEVWVFRLLWGCEPCVKCIRDRAPLDWEPVTLDLHISTALCKQHAVEDDENFRAYRAEQRRLSVVR